MLNNIVDNVFINLEKVDHFWQRRNTVSKGALFRNLGRPICGVPLAIGMRAHTPAWLELLNIGYLKCHTLTLEKDFTVSVPSKTITLEAP